MKPAKTVSTGRGLRAILAVFGLVAILHPAALGATPGGRGSGCRTRVNASSRVHKLFPTP